MNKLRAQKVPTPTQRFDIKMMDGAIIRVRRHGNPFGPRVFISHGNGFASDGYWQFWRLLLEEYDLIIYDQRSHGENPTHDLDSHNVETFANDLNTLLESTSKNFGEKPNHGIFHSLSAIVAVSHGQNFEWPWEALVLVDPPFSPPPNHHLAPYFLEAEKELSALALGRQEEFKSASDLATKFKRSKFLGTWHPESYEYMANATLSARGENYSLSCPPKYEAKIFNDNSNLNLTELLQSLPSSVLYICADPKKESARGPAYMNLYLHERYGLNYQAMVDTGHMLQLERPEEFVEKVKIFFASHSSLEE